MLDWGVWEIPAEYIWMPWLLMLELMLPGFQELSASMARYLFPEISHSMGLLSSQQVSPLTATKVQFPVLFALHPLRGHYLEVHLVFC